MTDASVNPNNTVMRRQTGRTKRGFEFHHCTQPHISEGTGRMYPATPMRVTKIPITTLFSRYRSVASFPFGWTLILTLDSALLTTALAASTDFPCS